MTNLKTLNDIEWNEEEDLVDKDRFIRESRLRQEAIKEIKLVESGGEINTERNLSWCKTAVGAYIAWKNNITEKDLKESK